VINGIESAIDGLVNQIPGGQAVQQDIKAAFVSLLDRVVRESAKSTSAPAPAATSAATATTKSSSPSPAGSVSTLWKDASLPGLEQLSNDLTAQDSAYNDREGELRDRLNVGELERRLRGYAESLGVEYSSTDLEGILRNAGYGAAHLGSSERYLSAVDRFTAEAFNNYRERAGNVPGLKA
jgi:hypothetical protein